jgi:hypothetical protein
MEKKPTLTFTTGISKDIQFKGIKYIDARTEAEKQQRIKPYYALVSKATGKPVMTIG